MKTSTDRILTTHTGSLPRATKLIELLLAEQQNRGARKATEGVTDVVRQQGEVGLTSFRRDEQISRYTDDPSPAS